MTTYYVSSGIGNDDNAGTSATAPLATLQQAADLVKPGDTVEVMNGTYSGPAYGAVVDITTSGTASAPITFEAAPGQTPVINTSGTWNGILIQASNIVINGFTVVGDAANYTLQTALAGYDTGNANLDGNGITVNSPDGVVVPNHITIENNTVYNEPGAGIGSLDADYVQVLNNVVYDNAHWSAFGASGISIAASVNSDTNPGIHDIISGNLVFGNAQLVPTNTGGGITDGEGIILDTNYGAGAQDPTYVGEFLVKNNTAYGNGSAGIESFLTNDAVITGNTVYGNNTENVQPASDAEILNNQSTDVTITNNITTAPTLTPPAAPVISGDTVDFDNMVTLNGTAEAGSTITAFDNSTQLGTTVTNTSGTWMFTTGALAEGSQSFTATATDSVGNVSSLSSPLVMTLNTPVNLVANGNFATGDFTDWTLGGNYTSTSTGPEIFTDANGEGGSTYAAGMGSVGADGTLSQTIATTAGQTYTLSFWLQNEGSTGNDFKAIWNGQTLLSLTNAAQFGYTEYTDTVTATGSTTTLEFSAANASSQWDLDNISLTTVGSTTTPPPAAPVISGGAANSNESVTLKGTAPDGSTVTVSDTGGTLGTATASSTGAWSFTTAALSAASYAFTATDTTSAGTSAASSPFDVTVTSSSPPPDLPAAPVISTGVENSNESVALTGTAPDGSTVTVSDGGATALGTATASSTGAWSFTTADLAAGSYAFTATDTTSAGTSATSSAFDVTVPSSSPPPSGSNLVANGNFATGDFTDWTLGGNYTSQNPGPEIFIDTNAEGGSTYAAGMGSIGADGTLSQTIATTAGQTYTLSFWLQNEGSTGNDFKAIWNGQTLLSLTNAAQFGYTEYTDTVTATGSTTTLEFSAANAPSQWDLDNISLTSGTSPATTNSLAGSSGSTTIATGAMIEIAAADTASVTFQGSTGTLLLDQPSTFSGKIFGFSGNGHLSGSDQIDLKGINYNSVQDSYADGVLTVTDGTDTVKLDFNGSYTLANFDFASDGSGGTIVYDPPVPTSNAPTSSTSRLAAIDNGVTPLIAAADTGSVTLSGSKGTLMLDEPASARQAFNLTRTISGLGAQTVIDLQGIAFDAQTTLGYSRDNNLTGDTLSLNDGACAANIALLGNYMASSFAKASDNHAGTVIAEAAIPNGQPLLSNPHHA